MGTPPWPCTVREVAMAAMAVATTSTLAAASRSDLFDVCGITLRNRIRLRHSTALLRAKMRSFKQSTLLPTTIILSRLFVSIM